MLEPVESTMHSKLEEAIESVLDSMADVGCDTAEYAKMADQLVKLYKALEVDSTINVNEYEAVANNAAKRQETATKRLEINERRRVSSDTLAIIAANIAGIIIIVGHERAHVIATKAIGFVSKLR